LTRQDIAAKSNQACRQRPAASAALPFPAAPGAPRWVLCLAGGCQSLSFLKRLPSLLKGINLVGVEWALLHDVHIGAFDADLNTVGLRYRDGRPKPGYGAFRALTLP
jgi:hypothetical protein